MVGVRERYARPMDRPARSARVSFGPLVLVSTLLAVVLAVVGTRDREP